MLDLEDRPGHPSSPPGWPTPAGALRDQPPGRGRHGGRRTGAALPLGGCDTLITEDQRFLLGVHYADYALGPHAVPMLDETLDFYPERGVFDQAVMGA